MNKKLFGIKSRNEIVTELVQQYKDGTAPPIVYICGPQGCGKSYILDNVFKGLEDYKKIAKYKDVGDAFQKEGNKKNSLNAISVSFGSPLFALGLGCGWDKDETKYGIIKKIIKHHLNQNSDILFFVDNIYESEEHIQCIVNLIIRYLDNLQTEFKVKLYLLLSDVARMSLTNEINAAYYQLEKYNVSDIEEYLSSNLAKVKRDELSSLEKLSNGNLKLVDLLYHNKTCLEGNYLEAIDNVVSKRLQQLKDAGKKAKLDENELIDVILSASLSIKEFTALTLSKIINQESTKILRELNVAQNENLIVQKVEHYDFPSKEIKKSIEKKTFNDNKHWLLDYYEHYTLYEPDNYYLRACYLLKYREKLTPGSFALFMLAYSFAWKFMDTIKINMIRNVIEENAKKSTVYLEYWKKICDFYEMLSLHRPLQEVENIFRDLVKDEFELPLLAELTRAYFHFLYENSYMDSPSSINIMNQCHQYAFDELVIHIDCDRELFIDETILRLNIIYDIAPCILDQMNRNEDFQRLYDLAKLLTTHLKISCHGQTIGQYIENTFNRKAFLFVNATQCQVYYNKAKSYFKKNQIWDEYCITLVCEAGTNIVIQEYDAAVSCCDMALRVCEEQNIILPSIEKLYNNRAIAQFFMDEKNIKNMKKICAAARYTIKQLIKLLNHKKCETEYVILTNICSLSLYINNERQYEKYKRMIENLYGCKDISDISDRDIDDFYRYYFSWFELYRNISHENWEEASVRCDALNGFVPSIFRKQEVFWEEKLAAVHQIIKTEENITSYNFCNNLVKTGKREQTLMKFFHRGLMLSDIQYTSAL